MRGKEIAVTGATSGLGAATAIGLARLGATVHLVVRNEERGRRTRAEILAQVPGAEILVWHCDLSSLAGVRAFAGSFDRPLHALVHNAGLLPPERTETAEGNELTLATHVLGPYLMTALLRPALRGGRVVFVSSGGMYAQPLDVEDPQYRHGRYRGAAAYARTKRMQVVLAGILAEEYAVDPISVHSTHPGWAATPGITDSLPRFAKLVEPILRTPEQGADTTVWLCAAEEPQARSGSFWHDRAPRPTHYFPWQHETSGQRARLLALCRELTSA